VTNSVIFHLVFVFFFMRGLRLCFQIQKKLRFNEFEETKYFGFFITGVLIMQGLFTIKLYMYTEGLKIMFFIAGIL